MCDKVVYLSQRLANEAIRKCKNSSHRSKIPKRSYYCKPCGGWHLTSMTKK